jgi:hypothetical protein
MTSWGWVLRLVLWSLLVAGLAHAASLLGPSDALPTLRSDILLWCGALIGVELVVWGFEALLDLLGQRMARQTVEAQRDLFEHYHEEAQEGEEED